MNEKNEQNIDENIDNDDTQTHFQEVQEQLNEIQNQLEQIQKQQEEQYSQLEIAENETTNMQSQLDMLVEGQHYEVALLSFLIAVNLVIAYFVGKGAGNNA